MNTSTITTRKFSALSREEKLALFKDNPEASKELLLIAIRHRVDPLVALEAAKHSNADEEVLWAGLQHSDYYVREAAVENPNATKKILMKAIRDRNYIVRLPVASHPNADKEVLMLGTKLFADCDEDALEEIMLRKDVDKEILMIGAQDGCHYVRRAAANNPNADDQVKALASSYKLGNNYES